MAKEESVIEIKAKVSDAEKKIADLEKQIQKLTTSTKESQAATKEAGAEINNASTATGLLDKQTGGAVTALKTMKTTLVGVTKGFKTMRLAIASTGIGLLIVAIGSLAAAFTGSEEGQNKWNKIMTVTGALVGNFVDLLADLGDKIINVFTNPAQSLKEFGNLIQTFVMDKINGALEGFGLIGSAIKKAFSGDFKGALNDAGDGFKKLNDNLNPTKIAFDLVVDGVKAATEATKEFIKEQENELAAAARVADMRAKADKIERDLKMESAELESKVADLRLKAKQQDDFTHEERLKFLKEAQNLEDQLLDKQTEYLTLRRDAQVLENTFSRSNKENLDKEAEAIAAVSRQEAARANKARQIQNEVNAITNQKKAADAKAAAEEKKRQDELAKYTAVTLEDKRKLELDGLKEHYEAMKLQVGDDEDALLELKTAYQSKEAEMRAKFREEDEKVAQEKINKEFERQSQEATDFDSKKELLEQQRATLLADETLSEEVRNQMLAANAQARGQIDALEAQQKKANLDMVAGFMNQAAELAGKETAEGKAVATAAALINTYAGMSEIWGKKSDAPTVATSLAQKIASSALVLATGFKTIKSINEVKVPNAPSGGSTATPARPAAPTFNVVGQSPATISSNAAAADAQIQNNNNNPQRAYVVSTDITSQQALDRDIEDSNTLG